MSMGSRNIGLPGMYRAARRITCGDCGHVFDVKRDRSTGVRIVGGMGICHDCLQARGDKQAVAPTCCGKAMKYQPAPMYRRDSLPGQYRCTCGHTLPD